MGWTDSHLHQFEKNRTFYVPAVEADFGIGMNTIDYSKVKISDLLKNEKDMITYENDFGDSWVHDVVLEKIDISGDDMTLPLCLTGKNNCTPEYCGGIWGYSDLLEVLDHPNHEEYEGLTEWLGGEFDSKHFGKDGITEMLQTESYGCFG